jgi:hypothetical protein
MAIAIVSPAPANSHPAEPASVTIVSPKAENGPPDVTVFASTHAVKNSSGGDTTTESRPLRRT